MFGDAEMHRTARERLAAAKARDAATVWPTARDAAVHAEPPDLHATTEMENMSNMTITRRSDTGATTATTRPSRGTEFERLVNAAVANGMKRAAAIRQTVHEHPDLHERYLDDYNANHDGGR